MFLQFLSTVKSLEDLNDCSQIGNDSIRHYFRNFCYDVIGMYGEKYLNKRQDSSQLESREKSYAVFVSRRCVCLQ